MTVSITWKPCLAQEGHEIILTPLSLKFSDFNISFPILTSFTGSSDKEILIVSPIPSKRSVPNPKPEKKVIYEPKEEVQIIVEKEEKKRKDFNNLMDVNEISEAIYKNIVSYNSIKLNNIFLKRKLY